MQSVTVIWKFFKLFFDFLCPLSKEVKTMTEEYRKRLKKLESSIAVNRQKAIVADQKKKVLERKI